MPNLATNLRVARAREGLRQWELSDQSGVHRNTIISIERGRITNPRTSTLLALAEALGVDYKDLIGEA